ncbi:MAG TPA: DedA family protein [Pyrinomonadaceae bacterium]|nr:DedA family protein [Pyrinomonadaceae bacterium]
MSLSDYLLGTLGLYGPPALFCVLLVGAIGIPTPGSLLLLVAGSFVEQGEMSLWPVLALGLAGSVAGDQIGYALGRWGGRRLSLRLSRRFGGEQRLRSAEDWLKRREGGAIFLSRWLLSPLGSVVNITAGATGYSWPRFLLYDLLGEALWVVLYVLLGRFFSDQVEELSGILGDFTWAFVGLLCAGLLGWSLLRSLRASPAGDLKASRRGAVADETS